MKKSTGSGAAGAVAGAYTLSVRQSSEPTGMLLSSSCGQIARNCVASRSSLQHACSTGARNRSAPTGGAAYGTPKNTRTSPSIVPRMRPLSVGMTAGSVDGATLHAGALVSAAASAPASVEPSITALSGVTGGEPHAAQSERASESGRK